MRNAQPIADFLRKQFFISHDSRDKLGFRVLAAALRRSKMVVWDYKSQADTVHFTRHDPVLGAAELKLGLSKRIAKAEFFLLILSGSSLANDLVRFEVAQARAAGIKRHRIGFLALESAPHPPWGQPFDELPAIVVNTDSTNADSLNNAVAELMNHFGINFVPIQEPHPHLPMMQKLFCEISPHFKAGGDQPAAEAVQSDYDRLIERLDRFGRCYSSKDYESAHVLMADVVESCRQAIPGYRPFYPAVALSLCLMSLGRTELALAGLRSLRDHPAADEHLHGAIGQAHLSQGRLADAQSAYERALEHCRTRGEPEGPARYNLLLIRYLMRKECSSRDLRRLEIEAKTPEEEVNQKDFLGALLLRDADSADSEGRKEESRRKLVEVEEVLGEVPAELATAATVTLRSQALNRLDRPAEAFGLLFTYVQALERDSNFDIRVLDGDQVQVYHQLARSAAENRLPNCSHWIYERRLGLAAVREWRFELERVRLWILQGNADRARRHCRLLLAGRCNPPQTEEDFYWSGLAHYLCGSRKAAGADLKRSGPEREPYRTFLQADYDAWHA